MRRVERIGDLREQADRAVEREPALGLDEAAQVGSGDQTHDDVEQAPFLACLVDGHDVRVVEPRGQASFLLEAATKLHVERQLRIDDLEGH